MIHVLGNVCNKHSLTHTHTHTHIYIYIERETERELGLSYTWCNLLLNSYFENPTIELHILYVLNIHAKFHANHM